MDYRLLGRTGVRIAPLCLGTDNILNPTPEKDAIALIDRALDGGINMIDTANSYMAGESERVIGRALKANGRRDRVVLATKAHYPTSDDPNDQGNSRRHLIRACEDSLKRLQTDHIDLYQLHRPSPEIHIDETLGALSDLIAQGKVCYAGTTTHAAWMVMELLAASEYKGFARMACEQSPYNLLDRRIENEMVPLCRKHDLGLICWSPMAMGILAGRYDDAGAPPKGSRAARRGGIYAERVSARGVEAGRAFTKLAKAHDLSPAQLAVLWVKDQPAVTGAIIGPKTTDQLEHLLPVLEMTLSEEAASACDRLVAPGSALADFHNSAPWMKMRVS